MEEKCIRCSKIVPWVVLLGNATLALFQIYIGYVAKSKGLVADGIHSGTDVVTTLMVIITVGLSRHRDDKKYPWGLGKSEFLGAVFAYVLLLGIACMILLDALAVIASGVIHPPHTTSVRSSGSILRRPQERSRNLKPNTHSAQAARVPPHGGFFCRACGRHR